MRYFARTLVVLAALSFLGCAANEKQAKTETPDEIAIKSFFNNFEAAWNKQDKAGFMVLWHADGHMKLTHGGKSLSKEEYANLLPKRMTEVGRVRMADIKIVKVEGNEAAVKVNIKKTDRDYPNVYHLVRSNGGWLYMDNSF